MAALWLLGLHLGAAHREGGRDTAVWIRALPIRKNAHRSNAATEICSCL